MEARQVTSLNTKEMEEAINTFKTGVIRFQTCRSTIDIITDELLSDWVGESKNEYEKQYSILNRNLKDIEDSLLDFYDALIESGAAYIETDEATAKEFNKDK